MHSRLLRAVWYAAPASLAALLGKHAAPAPLLQDVTLVRKLALLRRHACCRCSREHARSSQCRTFPSQAWRHMLSQWSSLLSRSWQRSRLHKDAMSHLLIVCMCLLCVCMCKYVHVHVQACMRACFWL